MAVPLPLQQDNSSFSAITPGLQLALDSVSLGAFKTCPRLYYYSIIQGWQPKHLSVHLTFGLLIHAGHERYHHARASGSDHDSALKFALAWVLKETWIKELNRGWQSDDPTKNRLSLIRTLVWYLDNYQNDTIETILLSNGKPAVELSFSFPLGYVSVNGEQYQLCGHIDRLGRLAGQVYILDPKTTGHMLTEKWFQSFTPGNQFSGYTLAGQIVYHQPVAGLIVDGIQVGATFARFKREIISRPEPVLLEWHDGLAKWLRQLESYAREGAERQLAESDPSPAWPMNDTSCDKYGGCDFRDVCSRVPGSRQQWLETNFKRRVWNPLERRGDI